MQARSTSDLLRTLLVFKACQVRPLVRHADRLLKWSKRLVGSTLVNALVKQTFYRQFVAGGCRVGGCRVGGGWVPRTWAQGNIILYWA